MELKPQWDFLGISRLFLADIKNSPDIKIAHLNLLNYIIFGRKRKIDFFSSPPTFHCNNCQATWNTDKYADVITRCELCHKASLHRLQLCVCNNPLNIKYDFGELISLKTFKNKFCFLLSNSKFTSELSGLYNSFIENIAHEHKKIFKPVSFLDQPVIELIDNNKISCRFQGGEEVVGKGINTVVAKAIILCPWTWYTFLIGYGINHSVGLNTKMSVAAIYHLMTNGRLSKLSSGS